MNKKQVQQSYDTLRKNAEAKLVGEQPLNLPDRSAEELLHELQVHQIELEMQNKTLQQAQLEMEISRDRYVDLYDFAPVGYLTLNLQGLIKEVNLTAANMLAMERHKLVNSRFANFVTTEDRNCWDQYFLRLRQPGGRQDCELSLMRADKSRLDVNLSGKCTIADSVHITISDITERRQWEALQRTQQKLEQQEIVRKKLEYAYAEWINAMDGVNDPIFLHDKDFRILRCNKAYQMRAGIPFKQIIGQPYYEIFPIAHIPMTCCLQAIDRAAAAEEEIKVGDASFRSRAFVIRDEQGQYLYSVHILEDITERKHTDELRLQSENLLRSVVENIPIRIFWKDRSSRYLGCNTLFALDSGHNSPDELPGKNDFQMAWKDRADLYRADDHMVITTGKQKLAYEELITTPNGGTICVLSSKVPLLDGKNQTIGILGIYEDISERKLLETTLDHSNRVLAARSRVNATLVHAIDENTLMQTVCQAIVDQSGFRMAWVGYVRHDEHKSIKVMASAGFDEGYLESAKLIWSETERGMGPSGRAVRSGMTQLCQDIAQDPAYLPWRESALLHGYAAAIALPLHDSDNTVFGILDVYADQVNAFVPAEIELLEEMAEDLSFGVRALRTRLERDSSAQKIRQQFLQLQNNLEDTIRAIASIVEIRDPYTAGHQRRVADLACAIARQMGLPDEQVHGIQIAGIVHDLGKIQVPAEILSKPGSLSEIEYALIKQHAQAGFDILKGVEFPWPVAKMVLQHHERLDGSGYPQGIKGDAILLDARILSVADVVEAMSSHRPYRAGLGVDAALDEITRGRGTHFDPTVVDACLSVILELKYFFPV